MRETGTPRRGLSRWLWLGAAAAIAVATIVALVVMLADATRDRDRALRQQESSSERVIAAATFSATMARAEAALGRFVISGDNALGTIYSDEWRRSGLLLDRLADASRGAERQTADVTRLRNAWRLRGEELAETALRTTYRQNSEALATFYRIRTSASFETLTATVERFVERERQILALRSRIVDSAVTRANRLTTLISIVGVLLVGIVGGLGFGLLGREERRRREEERAEALETAVADRTAELTESNARLLEEMATRETAEARLRQAQKMEAVGQLTGGIAHDFNNMLAVVVGGVEMAKRRIADASGNPEQHLDNAMEGAQRAAALTKRLLAFARAEPLMPTALDLDVLIEGMSDMLDRSLGERVEIRHIARADHWPVNVDRNQLESAILNLAVNARDAMPDGGTLTIATAQQALTAGEVGELPVGDYLRLSVSDTGTGIDRAVMDRIFEPFFTTKELGKGTGLGLSQVFGFVRQSQGSMAVDSTPGVGTTVSIYLPRHAGEVIPLPRPEPELAAARRPTRMIVVEDDPRVLAATCEALGELGHDPIACSDDTAAQTALDENPDIDLIVSDVLMPGLTGPELVARLRGDRPHLRALFVTGYAGESVDSTILANDIILRKPFTIAALSQAVATATATADGAPLETRAAA